MKYTHTVRVDGALDAGVLKKGEFERLYNKEKKLARECRPSWLQFTDQLAEGDTFSNTVPCTIRP